jgi:hypothetical protein
MPAELVATEVAEVAATSDDRTIEGLPAEVMFCLRTEMNGDGFQRFIQDTVSEALDAAFPASDQPADPASQIK